MPACTVCASHTESTFRVTGMDCHEEVSLLERRLGRIEGVHAISADVVSQRLRVSHDAARVLPSAIAHAVAETGMRAWIDQGDAVHHADPSERRRLALLVVSGTAIGMAGGLHAAGVWPGAEVALCALAILTGGVYTARRALTSARHRTLDMHVLMTVAVAGAMAIGEWFEASTVVFLFALAQHLEARSLDRARRAIHILMNLAPPSVRVHRGGAERSVPVCEVAVGDVFTVHPGERIALDAEVIAGESDVNQAPVTGESVPVFKGPGDEVFAGSVNGHGAVTLRATRLGSDSTVARIIHLVERAQAQRAPYQGLVDRFARVYTPAVIALSAAVAVVPPLAGAGAWSEWIYRALVLLVISCPCALVISTPVSIVSALAAAARRGVLIKGGVHLERTGTLRCVAFDKTGTLTHGRLVVTDVEALDGLHADQLLAAAAGIEARSEHPIGRAILAHARALGVAPLPADGFRALPGRGAEARVAGEAWLLGSHRAFEERGLCTPPAHDVLDRLAREGRTPVLLARAGRLAGVIGVADEARHASREVVRDLHGHGVAHVALLTGDAAATAAAVARETGVDEVRAELLPGHKVDAIADLRRRHGPVGMVGDGVNDAPALAAADVGFAMGAAGSDAALETADVALMGDDLTKVAFAIRLSRATLRNIRANIAVALGLKALFLGLAVAGHATLWMAVLADMGASLLVVGNGLRLLRAR
jgi:Cd2+/Zn2+-exporting ATPase